MPLAKPGNARYVQNVLNAEEQTVFDQFVDLGGRSAQRLGLPRSLGMIYAALYLSPEPLGLQDLMDQLHISKGGASMGVRQLETLGAVRKVWQKGDRKDFYEAVTDFSAVARHLFTVIIKPRIASSGSQLQDMRARTESGVKNSERIRFMRDRIAKLESAQKKIQKLLPLADTFLR
jgi:DNA-binding transcriptional regulator GbsR (MarR family)